MAYEEVPGPTHYNDPNRQPMRLENNEAYGVHKSGNEEISSETYSQEVNLKSNEAYGVRGEMQVAAINGTTDAVCYMTRLVSNLERQPVELKFKWIAMKHIAHLREIYKLRKLLTMIMYKLIVQVIYVYTCSSIVVYINSFLLHDRKLLFR